MENHTVDFKKHDRLPATKFQPRGGVFSDAIRELIAGTPAISFPFGGDTGYTAPELRNRIALAARGQRVKITTRTADGRVYAALRKGTDE